MDGRGGENDELTLRLWRRFRNQRRPFQNRSIHCSVRGRCNPDESLRILTKLVRRALSLEAPSMETLTLSPSLQVMQAMRNLTVSSAVIGGISKVVSCLFNSCSRVGRGVVS